MAEQAVYAAEQAIGHGDNAVIQQDVSDYTKTGSNQTLKALVWKGRNKVEMTSHPQELSVFAMRKDKLRTAEMAMYGGRTAGMFGYSHFTGGFAGGQAEYVRVPYGDVNLLEIPDDVPDEKALYLSDVLATSYNCVKDTVVYEKDQVAIFGAEPIGQMCGIFALGEGASKVIFVDKEPRLSFIDKHWPADQRDKLELVDYSKLSHGVMRKGTVVSRLKRLWRDGHLRRLRESPSPPFRCSLGILSPYLAPDHDLVPTTSTSARSWNVASALLAMDRHVHKYWEEELQMIQKGKLDPMQMVSHRVRLESLDEVLKGTR
ncbi:hypothetical protein HIM_08113 [Hirsutella minnesotensis 3608]|uniref:Alcohol dehydrogenase-like C-terminal domain-containing protein n=1 Tax=Hirsutella minnesotensis 3608 TaxID=1043627 RepID=A0A0F8A3U6_9HYPO|nr:hypothetical protein HIM_08113 [Hirsutella minnesotensis 3608]